MKLKKISVRFREMRSIYVGTKISFIRKLFYIVDYVFAFIIQGASISDYLLMAFINLDIMDEKNI